MTSIAPSLFLKRALIADACVSGACAVLQLIATRLLHEYTGLAVPLLQGTGLFLVGFVGLLVWLATRPALPAALVWLVIIGNLAWAAAAVVVSCSPELRALGSAFAWVQALAVALFAGLEYAGLARSEGALAGSAA